jgi:CheY-like chemotaxis protein
VTWRVSPLVSAGGPRAATICALHEHQIGHSAQVILVVDDDRTARELMVAALEPLGRRVVACASTASALQEIAANPPGLVFTDRRLGPTDGLELVRAIKSDPATSRIPVVVVSGDVSAGAAERAHAAGADGFLLKPVPLATLLREAERWLRPGD